MAEALERVKELAAAGPAADRAHAWGELAAAAAADAGGAGLCWVSGGQAAAEGLRVKHRAIDECLGHTPAMSGNSTSTVSEIVPQNVHPAPPPKCNRCRA